MQIDWARRTDGGGRRGGAMSAVYRRRGVRRKSATLRNCAASNDQLPSRVSRRDDERRLSPREKWTRARHCGDGLRRVVTTWGDKLRLLYTLFLVVTNIYRNFLAADYTEHFCKKTVSVKGFCDENLCTSVYFTGLFCKFYRSFQHF